METRENTRSQRSILVSVLFVTVIINYMDRTNLAIAAAAIGTDLQISPIYLGLLFSAFAWTYSGLQIPGGFLADVVKPRILYPILITLWSAATMLQAVVNSLGALVGCRALVGAFEAPTYPMNNRIVTQWFPEEERASAIAIYTSAQFLGLAVLTPLLALVQALLGWRIMLAATGAVGFVWAAIWYIWYREPDQPGEPRDRTLDSRHDHPKSYSWRDLRVAFSHRKLWGIYIGQYCLGTMTIFFLTWFITYLVQYRGIDFLQSGMLGSLPFIAAFVGVLLSGFVSDHLTRRGFSAAFSRKVPVLTGMLLSTSIIGANFTDDTALIISFLALSFFGNGLASITWVFVSLLAPRDHVGLVGGVFNFAGGLAAVITPIVIGYLASGQDFSLALIYVAVIAAIGFLVYVFMVGKVERLPSPSPSGDADEAYAIGAASIAQQ